MPPKKRKKRTLAERMRGDMMRAERNERRRWLRQWGDKDGSRVPTLSLM